MSEQQEQRDYEALNADTALRLNKAQQRITALEVDLKRSDFELDNMTTCAGEMQDAINKMEAEKSEFGKYIKHHQSCAGWRSTVRNRLKCDCGLDELLIKEKE